MRPVNILTGRRSPGNLSLKSISRFICLHFALACLVGTGQMALFSAETVNDCFACLDTSVPSPGSRVTGSFPLLSPPFSCTAEVIELSRNFSGDAILINPADHVWLGGFYSSSTVSDARPEEIVVSRKPIRLSVSLPNLATNSVVVENPTRSAVAGALNNILASAGTNTVNPARISFNYVSYATQEQTMLELGVNGHDVQNFFKVDVGFNGSETTSESGIFLEVFQPYFSAAIDQPQNPSDLIAEGVACQEIRSQLRKPVDAPLVAMNAVFGRAIFYHLTQASNAVTKLSHADLVATFQNAVLGSTNAATNASVLGSLRIKALVLGGGPAAATGLMDLDGARKVYQDGLVWSSQSPGYPLLYSYHCLRPGFPQFSYGKSTAFVSKNCSRDSGDGLWQIYWFGWDNGHENTYKLLPDGSPRSPGGLPGTPGSPWNSPRVIGQAGGRLEFGYPQDYNVYAETYLYVNTSMTIPFSWSADTGFIYLNGTEVDGRTQTLRLNQGVNHLVITGYNQHQGSGITVHTPLASLVEWMDHAPPGPVLASNLERLDFNVEEGAQKAAKTVFIGNLGTGTMNYSFTPSVPWISVEPDSGSTTEGTASKEHTITVQTDNLLAGRHEATLMIEANADQLGGQALVLPVAVEVAPPAVWIDETPIALHELEYGQLSFFRKGVLSVPLSIQLTLGGLLGDSDFKFLPRVVRFPLGQDSAKVDFLAASSPGLSGQKDGIVGIVPSPGYQIQGLGRVNLNIQSLPPVLRISHTASEVILQWGTQGGVVESSEVLPAVRWRVESIVEGNTARLPITSAVKFYRVRR